MKKRPLFAEVRHFFLYDVYSPEGNVNENIFAYSNRLADDKALVVFNNCFEHAIGWIKTSVGFKQDDEIRQSSLIDGLNLSHQNGTFVIFRDHASGMEFIRSNREIAENGLMVALDGYKYNVFLEFREVRPSKLRPYDRLAAELNGQGTESIEEAVLTMSLSPLHQLVTAFLTSEELIPSISGVHDEEEAPRFEKLIALLLGSIAEQFSELMERPLAVPETLPSRASALYHRAAALAVCLPMQPDCRKLQTALGLSSTHRSEYCMIAKHWIVLDAIQQMVESGSIETSNLIDDWLMSSALASIYPEKGAIGIPGENLPDLLCCMLDQKPELTADGREAHLHVLLQTLFAQDKKHFSRLLQFDERHQKFWFREHRFSVLIAWLTLQELLKEPKEAVEKEEPAAEITQWREAIEKLEMQAFLAGYEIGQLINTERERANKILPED
jgi:hypothetical protein